jgi:hypothetical protein
MTVRRTLPQFGRTTIGAWCFVDHFGPNVVADAGGMSVGPRPHTGLQTVTWLFEGEVEHRDSVGSHVIVRPGQVNLMTAGEGISHSEHSTSTATRVHGVQLWVALPDADRHTPPFFEHHVAPRTTIGAASIIVFAGSLAGLTSDATTFTPLVGAEILVPAGTDVTLPVDAHFEHGILVDQGSPLIDGETVERDHLLYVPPGITALHILAGDTDARLVLLGGEPFGEQLVMWWNFIGRSHDEIVNMRAQWQADVVNGGNSAGVFGHVSDREVIPAPEMPNVRLRPRG